MYLSLYLTDVKLARDIRNLSTFLYIVLEVEVKVVELWKHVLGGEEQWQLLLFNQRWVVCVRSSG